MSIDNLELIEDRVAKLENLVGKFEKIDQTKGLETLLELSNKVSNLSNNPKVSTAFKSLSDIKKYTNFDALTEIEDETLIKAKIELILSEEENLIKLNEDFKKLSSLSKILDNQELNDIPKLSEKLKDLGAKQASIKEGDDKVKNELKNFLSVYYTSMKSINETLINLSEYLDQFDKEPKEE